MTILEALVKLRDDIKLWCTNNFNKKLNKNLGTKQADKFLVTNESGEITTADIVTTTDELNYVSGVTSNIQEQLDNINEKKADTSHTHNIEDINELQLKLDILNENISEKVDTEHVHEIADINELQSTLDVLNENISNKADASHIHSISDVTNLQSSLDEKIPISRTINGKPLSSDVSLVASDVGADVEGSANSALEAAKSYADDLASGKSNVGHSHDELYYTEGEIDTKVSEINTSIENIINGTTVVAKATHASDADSAIIANSATSATQDASGNIITTTYETKDEASAKLTEAKSYADGIKNDLLNNAGEAYDTLKELGDLIDDNTDAIEALEIVATGKANAVHSHDASDITSGTLSSDILPVVPVSKGGTGADTLDGAKTNLGIVNIEAILKILMGNSTWGLTYELRGINYIFCTGIGTATETDIKIASNIAGTSVTNIGNLAFQNCTSLTSVTIPNSVTKIGSYAFSGCTSLTSVTIPDSVTYISNDVFNYCTSLTSVTLSDNITEIVSGLFRNCSSLTSINIPDGVTKIGSYAFFGCTSLTSVTIPDSVTTIINGAFEDCTNLTDIYYTGTEEQWVAISIGDSNNEALINATIHYNTATV